MMEFDIRSMIPRFIMQDRNGYAMAKAIEAGMKVFLNTCQDGIDCILDAEKMPEWRLDEMAWEYSILYDYSANIERKRNWIRDAIQFYSRYGTAAAIMKYLEGAYDDAAVEEWWEYDGDPYHFRVMINSQWSTIADAWTRKAVGMVQNVRSVLDGVMYSGKHGDAEMYVATAIAGMIGSGWHSNAPVNPLYYEIIAHLFIIREVFGNRDIVLGDAGAVPALAMDVEAKPVQEGKGSPSTTNIRPFLPVTSVRVGVSHENLYNLFQGYIRIMSSRNVTLYTTDIKSEAVIEGTSTGALKMYLSLYNSKSYYLPAGSYVIVAEGLNEGMSLVFDGAGYNGVAETTLTAESATGSITVTDGSEPFKQIYLSVGSGVDCNTRLKIAVLPADMEPEYVPYTEDDYTATWDDPDVYGCNFDFVSGNMMVTWAHIASYDGEALPGRWMSDRDVYIEGTTPTIGAEVVYRTGDARLFTDDGEQVYRFGNGQSMTIHDADGHTVFDASTDRIELYDGDSIIFIGPPELRQKTGTEIRLRAFWNRITAEGNLSVRYMAIRPQEG